MYHYLGVFTLLAVVPTVASYCKCVPGQECWPSEDQWARFNYSINSQLIATNPVASPCYRGTLSDNKTCDMIARSWSSADFQSSQPIGYAYPLNNSCPLVISTSPLPESQCTVGGFPTFAVNVTSEDHIVDTIQFAKLNNIRAVLKSTGHDFLQRSTGHGSISIWLRHLRQGFTFNNHKVIQDCFGTVWNGSTLTIRGSYAWSDLYEAAAQNDVILVGGNNEGPSSTGGWVQGGGHSPVTRYYGLGANQVLSARVILASGEIVQANRCTNSDLFYAIRGGGGGTFGVVTEMTVKTYPSRNVTVAKLTIESQGEDTIAGFLDAVTEVYASYPRLSLKGFAGYGYWSAHVTPSGNVTKPAHSFQQSFIMLGVSLQHAQESFSSLSNSLARNQSNRGVQVSISWHTYYKYASYYKSKDDTVARVGSVSALSSRLLDAEALSQNITKLRRAMDVMAGSPGKPVYHTIVHHGMELSEKSLGRDGSGVQPGWYRSVILDIFERAMNGTQVSQNLDAFAHLRQVLTPTYRELSPKTGTYMNEADWGDLNWQEDFFGSQWKNLSTVKAKYDPNGVFYCETCVGSDEWHINNGGALCQV
ncbi:hypothetical protein COCCADRAFT_113506 [Bipolaris zeicola 26-R-13]|uniref:FAD-binding PCMH-type domain-containing protein n=1 Tax=Cochliobolus carbonum (strain 26-R-13) TaxID=930089 RepID=W6Y647_COCC2|nr:uncharacterized protein COCCADRAFT_113506 [Bipolaris zeicola 26-R-13]EUC26741.1 hypothetical protein COCCADRAFT_113506 [Bipolaris zeicola 26-R-13]